MTKRANGEPLFVIGDVHGEYEKLIGLLRDAALVGSDLSWSGGGAVLWFLGDFFDRGPDGTRVVECVRRLQREAASAGGHVGALLGNHDLLLLGAHLLGPERSTGLGSTFRDEWELAGGVRQDLRSLTPDRIAWIQRLPAMARVGEWLLTHADAHRFYTHRGASVAEVNRSFAALLQNPEPVAWDRALDEFSERKAFAPPGDGGAALCCGFLERFGGRQLIHGHTPISAVTGRPPEEITGPLIYAGGLAVNVDGGMCLGGPGFVHRLR